MTLTRQVNALRDRLTEAGLQAMAVEERRNIERSEFQVANQRLLKAQVDFENCYGRVAELVLQLLEPTADDEILGRYVREYLENCVLLRAALAGLMSTPSKFNGHLIAGVPTSRYCGSG